MKKLIFILHLAAYLLLVAVLFIPVAALAAALWLSEYVLDRLYWKLDRFLSRIRPRR